MTTNLQELEQQEIGKCSSELEQLRTPMRGHRTRPWWCPCGLVLWPSHAPFPSPNPQVPFAISNALKKLASLLLSSSFSPPYITLICIVHVWLFCYISTHVFFSGTGLDRSEKWQQLNIISC